MSAAEKFAEINMDFYDAVEAAAINAKRQLATLYQASASSAQPEQKSKTLVAISETTFTALKFEPQTGVKLGEYEVAYRPNNDAERWDRAHQILEHANAKIDSRYHGEGYVFSYWIYGSNKIYRQRLKAKA